VCLAGAYKTSKKHVFFFAQRTAKPKAIFINENLFSHRVEN
jgi:hypothetical protein